MFQMLSTYTKSRNNYVVSLNDYSNNIQQTKNFANDAFDYMSLSKEYDSYKIDHYNSLLRITKKYLNN